MGAAVNMGVTNKAIVLFKYNTLVVAIARGESHHPGSLLIVQTAIKCSGLVMLTSLETCRTI